MEISCPDGRDLATGSLTRRPSKMTLLTSITKSPFFTMKFLRLRSGYFIALLIINFPKNLTTCQILLYTDFEAIPRLYRRGKCHQNRFSPRVPRGNLRDFWFLSNNWPGFLNESSASLVIFFSQ